MNVSAAQKVIEELRKGIPPDGLIREFTVGREEEIHRLESHLSGRKSGALLLQANYGAGKTHLLRYIRQSALEKGFLVSCVTIDAKSEVRFNRLDQVVGAVMRNIEIPRVGNAKGVRVLLDLISDSIAEAKGSRSRDSYWRRLTNSYKWDYSEVLDSSALFVVLRAWCCNRSKVHDLAEDYLYSPWNYKAQRKRLYLNLVEQLRAHFRDPRPDWKFYADQVFSFDSNGHSQSWAVLRDVDQLAKECGYSGLILMFDEFEDVITNMSNIKHQEDAFLRLFQFFSGRQFPSMSFFAVTPEFASKCKILLFEKDRIDFDFGLFDSIPTFQMSPLDAEQLWELCSRIVQAHAVAYDWDPEESIQLDEFKKKVKKAASRPIQDRARITIKTIVSLLDDGLEGS